MDVNYILYSHCSTNNSQHHIAHIETAPNHLFEYWSVKFKNPNTAANRFFFLSHKACTEVCFILLDSSRSQNCWFRSHDFISLSDWRKGNTLQTLGYIELPVT